jgi:AraC family transcriptional regulator
MAHAALRPKKIDGFRLVEKSYPPGSTLPMHEHPGAYISVLIRGAYRELCRQDERLCFSGTMIWHPFDEAHADQFAETGGLVMDIEIERWWLDAATQKCRLSPLARVWSGGRPYSLGLQLYRALSGDALPADDLGLELLSFFFSGTFDTSPPVWFRQVLRMVADLGDRRLSLANAARQAGVHPVHLARSFRRFTGCTFGEYVAQRRLRTAFDLLVSADHTIADVAYACGFADQAHLCRCLRSATGLTPSQFRRHRA